MDRKATEICKFLVDWSTLLTEDPVEGSIPEIYFCFVSSAYSKGKDKVSWLQFIKYLRQIDALGNGGIIECLPPNCLQITYDDPFKCAGKVTHINRLALGLLLRKGHELSPPSSASSNSSQHNNGSGISAGISHPDPILLSGPSSMSFDDSLIINEKAKETTQCSKQEIPATKDERLAYLLELIDGTPSSNSSNDVYPVQVLMNKKLVPKSLDDTYTLTSKARRLEQMEHLLSTPCASHALQRERARLRTEIKPFFDCCEDQDHANLLGNFTTFDKSTNYCVLNEDKLKRFTNDNNGKYSLLNRCVQDKMHFIPIIQSQTDIKLGDCSYLDTCHKMNSCRYIHYGQLMPLKHGNIEKEIKTHNDEINDTKRLWDFTRGEPTALYTKGELPKQWINCDITKLDFSVLGDDFGVVVADPSWTIHMNLNYSSLKDEELMALPMDKLQKEGIFLLWVTGRTIETGREFLKRWGYKVENQLTWIKTSQLIRTISTGRTGHWLNHSKEHLLIGIKGDPKWLNRGMDPQILISSTRETSRKPDELYGMVERLVGDGVRKLEIFGRQHNTRPGWVTIGNQLKNTVLVERELTNRYECAERAERIYSQ